MIEALGALLEEAGDDHHAKLRRDLAERLGGGAGNRLGEVEEAVVLGLAEVRPLEQFLQADDLRALGGGGAHALDGAREARGGVADARCCTRPIWTMRSVCAMARKRYSPPLRARTRNRSARAAVRVTLLIRLPAARSQFRGVHRSMLLALLALLPAARGTPPPAKPAAPPKLIERVEVTPASAEVGVGQTLQLAAKAYDANGNVLPDASFRWFTGGDEGSVSETGLVKAGYRGKVRVTVAASMPGSKPAFGEADVKVIPSAPARIVVEPSVSRMVVGTHLSITGTPYSHENDRRYDPVTFTSSNPKVAQVSPDGRVVAVAPGSATLTAKAAGATQAIAVQVLAGPVSKVMLTPDKGSVLTGDVVRFKADVRGAAGKALGDVAVRWTVEAGGPEASAIDRRRRRLRRGDAGQVHRHGERRRPHRPMRSSKWRSARSDADSRWWDACRSSSPPPKPGCIRSASAST